LTSSLGGDILSVAAAVGISLDDWAARIRP
jgi:hypothetical protein